MFDDSLNQTIIAESSSDTLHKEGLGEEATTTPTSFSPRERALDHRDAAYEILPPLAKDQNVGFTRIQALRGLQLHDINSRSELVRELTKNIPVNEYGMPAFIYRSDLLDYNVFRTTDDQDLLNGLLLAAKIVLSYEQGFPAFPNGLPVWTQMSDESKESYQSFLQYLEITGVRILTDPSIVDPVNSSQWMHTYYWMFRSRAYDMFRSTHHNRQREERIIKTEDCHFLESQALLQSVLNALKDPGKLEELNKLAPDELISLFEKLTKIQRVSLGLPALGAPTIPRAIDIPDVSVTLRKMAETNKPVSKIDDASNVVDDIQGDAETLQVAQELILRIGNGGPK